MAITKEDGTSVADSDSFADHNDLTAWATAREITLTASTQAQLEALLYKAMDYLARFTGKWKGERVYEDQSLDWPRSGVYVDNLLLPEDEIPRQLFYAQLSLAVAADSVELLPVAAAGDKGPVAREKVDVLEVAYHNPSRVLSVAADAGADALLRVLLRNSGLRVVRA